MANDKTTLAYWMRQTGGRKNAAYTLQKEYNHALQGRGKARTFKPIATSEMSVPRGYQYSPDTYKAPRVMRNGVDQAFGMPHPAGARGLVDFQPAGSKVPLETKHALGMGALIAAPFALAAAVPAIATGVAGASAIGAYGGLAAGLAGAAGLATKFVRGAGGAVSKGARSAASPWVASTVKPVTRVPKRVVKPKVTKPKVTKPTNPTAAMDYHTGALGGQSAKMGGSGARR